ncbi:MAG: rhomboid family intramembrane serine protease [Candidatus Aenigmatarchaeota archaeon]
MRANLIILAVVLAFFALQASIDGFTEAFLLDSAKLAARPWTIITAMFLHGDVAHLVYNMLALVMFGLVLESIIGTQKFWVLYFSGGIVAGIVAALFYPASLGASGAIFAVLGALAVLRPRMMIWVGGFPMPMALAAVVWVVIDLIGFIAPSGVANAAHIAGLAFGAAAGLVLRRRFGQPLRRHHSRRVLSERDIERWEDGWMRR